MNVKWIIEEDEFNENYMESLCESLDKLRCEYKIIKYMPFTKDIQKIYPEDACVMSYGSINLIKQIRRTSWIPGCFCNFDNFKYSKYASYLGKYLLNQSFVIVPLEELIRRKYFFYKTFGEDSCIFIRPNNGDKPFTGTLIFEENFEGDISLIHEQNDPDLLIVVSDPKIIREEWRFFVSKKKVLAGSRYQHFGKHVEESCFDKDAIDFVRKILLDIKFEPDPIYTIDVCKTSEGYHILELNSFSCAGFYGCNIDILTKAVTHLAWEEYSSIMEELY